MKQYIENSKAEVDIMEITAIGCGYTDVGCYNTKCFYYMIRNIKIVLLITFIASMITSCDYKLVKSLVNESSDNSKISKEKGYFISSYDTSTIRINDSIDFKILEIFAERPHRIKSYNDYSYLIDSTKFQIVIKFNKDVSQLKGYRQSWGFDNIHNVHTNKFIGVFNNIEPLDTIAVKLLTIQIDTSGLAGKFDNMEFGKFKIIKKK